jgi:sarcosine oxidase
MSSRKRGVSQATVAVVGLGAIGSAAAHALAAAGHRVLGFDRWSPPHTHGSTHGESRITRATAWEGAQYVPLVRRANELWGALEQESDAALRAQCGGLFIGRPDEYHVAGSRDSAERTGLPYELLEGGEIVRRWPHLVVPDGMVGFVDPGAGVLYPERILRVLHRAATSHGAQLHFDEAVTSWRADGDGVCVSTARRTTHADRLILCTGAWMPEVLTPLGVSLTVERLTLHWFAERADAPEFHAEDTPVLLLSDGHGHATAAFPTLGGCIKAAGHGSGEFATAESVDRDIRVTDIAPVEALVRRYLPHHLGAHQHSATCLYTNTPHGHFILDHHPEHPQIVLGSPCNGFGFKFASASGEILANLAVNAPLLVDATPWRLPR